MPTPACASLLRRATELQAPRMPPSAELFARLNLPEEISLLRRLSDFPDFVEDAAAAREPHRMVSFISDLAGEFQSYYTRLQKVHGDSVLPRSASAWAIGVQPGTGRKPQPVCTGSKPSARCSRPRSAWWESRRRPS